MNGAPYRDTDTHDTSAVRTRWIVPTSALWVLAICAWLWVGHASTREANPTVFCERDGRGVRCLIHDDAWLGCDCGSSVHAAPE